MNEPHHPQHRGPEPAPADLAAGHEVSDVSIRGLVTFLVGLVISLAVVVLAVAWMFVLLIERSQRADPPQPPLAGLRPKEPPAPHLQPSPAFEMRMMRDEQEAALAQTKWIDQRERIVQMPIDRAIELVAERGLPDWPRVELKQSADPHAGHEHRDDQPAGSGKNLDSKPAKQP